MSRNNLPQNRHNGNPPHIESIRRRPYDTFNGSVLALRNGDVDGVVINGANAGAYEAEFAGELVVTIRDLKADPLGLVFQKGDERVVAFNEGLAAIKADGTLDKLNARYWTAAE